VAIPVLRKAGARGDFLNRVWLDAKHEDVERVLRCPHCHAAMAQVTARAGDHALDLDVCTYCNAIWFDHGEFRALPRDPDHVHPTTLSPKAREQAALLTIQAQKETEDAAVMDGPPEGWQWLAAIFGLPVVCDGPALRGKPWLTWSIAGVLVLAFVATFNSLEAAAEEWGFISALWARHGGLTLVTSFFLHAGLPHLLSNLYFLLIFSNNVEDRLGPVFFILLLVGSHVTGVMVHGAFSLQSTLPCVGASAGICGILGYYGLTYPMARIGFLWRVAWIQLPAVWVLGLYVLLQIVGAWQQVAGFGSVSSLAHLGGLAVGIGAALAVRMTRNRPMDFGTPQEEPRTP
jgi:membrane associated rhomboid family serine protease